MPNKNDWFTEIKKSLIILNLNTISRALDILDVFTNYPNGFENINLAESFEKLKVVNNLNTKSLKALIEYINYLEISSSEFSKEELLNMVEILELAYKSQDKFVLDIINYILIDEDVITNDCEVKENINNYRDSNIYGYSYVKESNKKIIRTIKQERRDNLE